MKTSCIILFMSFLLSLNALALANPIALYVPIAHLNEVYFDSQGNWTIELKIEFPEGTFFSDTAIKQIEITSHSGTASLLHFSITSPATLLVITIDSLSSPLFINPADDFLTATTTADSWFDDGGYAGIYYTWTNLSYGPSNWSNNILNLPSDASISLIDDNFYYYIDTSPTIGSVNDTIGGLGQIHGKLFDCDGNVFTSGLFKIQDNLAPFMQFNTDSTFNMVTPANNWDLMYVLFYPDAFPIAKLISNPAWVNVEPGKTTVYDIHLMDSTFHVGFDEKNLPQPGRIIVAPNPFSSSLQFYFSLEGYPEDATLIIYTSTGKEIYSTALPKQKEFRVSVDGNRLGTGGTYYYTVTDHGKKLGNGKLLYIP